VSDLRHNLKSEFQNEDYRYAYAESFLNTKLAAQIKVLRELRGKTQAEMGCLIGTKQSGFSRFEDVNHTVWKTDTLWRIARALSVRVDISFETFGSLIDQKERFSRQSLERPDFANDPAFSLAGLEQDVTGNQAPQISGHHGALSQFPNVIQLFPQEHSDTSGIIGSPWLGFEPTHDQSQRYSERPQSVGSALVAAKA